MGFAKLTQSYPQKGTVTDYSRRFRTFCKLLGFDLKPQVPKFIDGLTSQAVKSALRRHNLEEFSFRKIVELAAAIHNNIALKKSSDSVMVGGKRMGWMGMRRKKCHLKSMERL